MPSFSFASRHNAAHSATDSWRKRCGGQVIPFDPHESTAGTVVAQGGRQVEVKKEIAARSSEERNRYKEPYLLKIDEQRLTRRKNRGTPVHLFECYVERQRRR